MSAPASYAFLSVLRRGLAALVSSGGPATDVRVVVPFTVGRGLCAIGHALAGPARSRRRDRF
jgi:hypothetical protein